MLLVEQPSSLLICKGTLTCITTFVETWVLPPQVKKLLKEFNDIFSKEGPIGLPHFRGIELFSPVDSPRRLTPTTTLALLSLLENRAFSVKKLLTCKDKRAP